MTDIELFEKINEIREICDRLGVVYSGDFWTRGNIAWIFEKARQKIEADEALKQVAE